MITAATSTGTRRNCRTLSWFRCAEAKVERRLGRWNSSLLRIRQVQPRCVTCIQQLQISSRKSPTLDARSLLCKENEDSDFGDSLPAWRRSWRRSDRHAAPKFDDTLSIGMAPAALLLAMQRLNCSNGDARGGNPLVKNTLPATLTSSSHGQGLRSHHGRAAARLRNLGDGQRQPG